MFPDEEEQLMMEWTKYGLVDDQLLTAIETAAAAAEGEGEPASRGYIAGFLWMCMSFIGNYLRWGVSQEGCGRIYAHMVEVHSDLGPREEA
jgi:hypothetical protein